MVFSQILTITKSDKDFAKELDFKGIKFPVKVRDMHKTEKKNSIDISVSVYENKEKHPVYVSKKCCEEKRIDLSLTGGKANCAMFLLKILIRSCMIILYIVEKTFFPLLLTSFQYRRYIKTSC